MTPTKRNLRNLIILIVIIVLCLIVITVSFKDSNLIAKVKISTLDFFKPIQEKTFTFFKPVTNLTNSIRDFFNAGEKLAVLREENAALRKDYTESINLKIENNALRELLGVEIRKDFDTEQAKVIGFYKSKWQSEAILNIGRSSGILEGMAVINEDGLIGTVIFSANNSCKVRLINDSQSSIGARILSSRKLGIIEGSSEGKIYLNYISVEEIVQKGDVVITSEFGEYIPSEVLIGRVKRVTEIYGDPYKEIEIDPYVDFWAIEYVLVIKK